jgi:hypothetical protein
MNVRTVRLVSLTGAYLVAVALFLILRSVDHYSIFTSLFVSALGLFGFTKKREKPRRSGRGWIARRRDGSTPSKPSAYRYILPVND